MSNYFLKFSDFTWTNTNKCDYKPANDSPDEYKDITIQNIVENSFNTNFNLSYFECGEKGFTNLDKHEHPHVIIIVRGEGKAIIGDEELTVKPMDVLIVPDNTAHQFFNANTEPFGFFCIS